MLNKGMFLSTHSRLENQNHRQNRQCIRLRPNIHSQRPLEISNDFNNIPLRIIRPVSKSRACTPDRQMESLRLKIQELTGQINIGKQNLDKMKNYKQVIILKQDQQYNEGLKQLQLLEKEYYSEKRCAHKWKFYDVTNQNLQDLQNRIDNMINI